MGKILFGTDLGPILRVSSNSHPSIFAPIQHRLRAERLENFLAFVPQLKAIKLVSMWYRCNSNKGYNGPRLLRYSHTQSLAINLDVVHCSSRVDNCLFKSNNCWICPILSEWHLRPRDVSPSFLKQLDVHTDRLKTLEFDCVSRRLDCPSYANVAAFTIHDVVSMSGKDVHLKSLKTVARQEDMDVYRYEATSPRRRQLWSRIHWPITQANPQFPQQFAVVTAFRHLTLKSTVIG
ncbi:MAG: hypothetical protein JOS17DRAFT_606344 [Linnemannia elongata]|nr:MAG: hypothetical protein JOS17DRAFT_606344 [Linnemannia elongata]